MKSLAVVFGITAVTLSIQGAFSPATAQTSGTAGATLFVGTIESINPSNRTIQVSGVESVMRSVVTNSVRSVASTTTTTKPKRVLEQLGDTETRTFYVGGFCKIEKQKVDTSKMGVMRPTIADLQTGERVAVEFTRGVGNAYTAKGIQAFSMLDVSEPTKPKTPTTKKK